ncbi:hypothetical protein BpHYR1_006093 [Brachionus plicatilis]|uniref:Uncharacterized protein n=1 Tax=Brachionus plicatilis TaxID=10195 RepID=A0A3M7SG42_BRAPC|nr:hypothetical protein BpHYR1_006093 [Brachionus plicatilis]
MTKAGTYIVGIPTTTIMKSREDVKLKNKSLQNVQKHSKKVQNPISFLEISTFLIKTTNIKKNKIINQNPHPRALQPIRLRLKPILLNH